ncbi:ABC transporter permease subunit [Paenibacillus foliorum]|uniref:ABC transporter permease subunit n=1 Tax=Paenibacillus foliorum TaxID=2654974 RepID=UPI001FE8CCDA|nr:ABC transporter permease subunit [Paenibacillus foliorum]
MHTIHTWCYASDPSVSNIQNAWHDSNPISLIITYSTFQLPFNSILMSGFVSNIPDQLEEAAMVDGCSRIKAVFLIIFPILLPGIVATTVFTYIGAWNEFLFSLMLINKPQFFMLPIGLRYMQGEFNSGFRCIRYHI